MKIALIADTFPPLRSSGAVQLRDLAREFLRQGHELTVLLPSSDQIEPWKLEEFDGVKVLRLKSPRTKDTGYVIRTLGEFIMPFAMLRNFRKTHLANTRWDGIVWYAPSIFHGPLISRLKKISRCKSYLIVRDIFPEWAVDMGLMGRGLPYIFFNAVAKYQYSIADVIGVQTPGNNKYFERWMSPSRKLEVLKNWLDKPGQAICSIKINETILSGRKIFIYAGNMGVAQGMSILLELAVKLKYRLDVGFLFVGRGSDLPQLIGIAEAYKLDNVLFFDEIHPDEIPGLYAQCTVGIVALDPRHKSHNIPGKFLTYMQSGLPVLANINAGNDLSKIIREERVGQVCESNSIDELFEKSLNLIDELDLKSDINDRCIDLFNREFLVENSVKQIVNALSC